MTVPETSEKRGFVLPADYYSSATPPPVLPRGVAYGCGAASAVALLIIFIGGALVSTGGLIQLIDLSLGSSLGQVRGMYAKDVTPAQKQSFESEVEKMREGMRTKKVSLANVQPFLQGLQSAVSDNKVTAQELQQLEATTRKINAGAKR